MKNYNSLKLVVAWYYCGSLFEKITTHENITAIGMWTFVVLVIYIITINISTIKSIYILRIYIYIVFSPKKLLRYYKCLFWLHHWALRVVHSFFKRTTKTIRTTLKNTKYHINKHITKNYVLERIASRRKNSTILNSLRSANVK